MTLVRHRSGRQRLCRVTVRVDLTRLSDVVLDGADGGRHRLGDFWTEKPVIVVFLRHFG